METQSREERRKIAEELVQRSRKEGIRIPTDEQAARFAAGSTLTAVGGSVDEALKLLEEKYGKAKKSAPVKVPSDDEDEDESEEEKKPAPSRKRKAPASKAKTSRSKKKVDTESESEASDSEEEEEETPPPKKGGRKAKAAAKPARKPAKGKKKSKDDDDDEESEVDAKKKSKATRKRKAAASSDDEEEEKKSASKKQKKKPATKAKKDEKSPAKKRTVEIVCDENEALYEAFRELQGFEFKNGNKFQAMTYSKLGKIIREMEKPITSGKDLDGIKGVGKISKQKVQEFLDSGTMAKLEEYRNMI